MKLRCTLKCDAMCMDAYETWTMNRSWKNLVEDDSMSSIASRGPHSSQMMRARRSYSKAANLWASERAVLSRQLFSLEGAIDQSASQSRRVRSRRIFKGVTRGRLQGGSRAFRCKNTDVKRPRGWPPARSARGRVRFEKAASAMRFPCLLGLLTLYPPYPFPGTGRTVT